MSEQELFVVTSYTCSLIGQTDGEATTQVGEVSGRESEDEMFYKKINKKNGGM